MRALLAAADDPRGAQLLALARAVRENANTAYGREHGFRSVVSAADMRKAAPIATYEDLRENVERQELTGEPCLTVRKPIYYARTSGTAGAPKNIPVTPLGLMGIRAQRRLAAFAVSRLPNALSGRLFAVTGRVEEGRLPGGAPFGSMSGLLYRQQPRLLRSRHVLPPALSEIDDYETQYLAMAAHGIAAPDVTCVATANASTLLRLLSLLNQRAEEVLRSVADGRSPAGVAHPGPRAAPRRARELGRKLDAQGELDFADVWPRLAAVIAWKGGSCGVAVRNLRPTLPANCRVVELGYLASEVHGTINIRPERDVCLPALRDTFFEFAERDAWEADHARQAPELRGLHELEDGGDYYVFVTTRDGLYRYDMNDIVRVTGRIGQTPTLAFVQKGKGVTSITGEKLYEAQALEAVSGALEERGCRASFFIVLADRERAEYTLFLEAAAGGWRASELADAVDGRLKETNAEYAGKRASGRLRPMRAVRLSAGAGAAYRADRVAAGQREMQFKFLHLQYADECPFPFADYCFGAATQATD